MTTLFVYTFPVHRGSKDHLLSSFRLIIPKFNTCSVAVQAMKAVVITRPGEPEVLEVHDVDEPVMKDDEVLIKVAAAALNRADTFHRKGLYELPSGDTPYLGMECSGTILALGNNVTRWKVNDQVCALLHWGGYAEKVAVPAAQVLPIPPGVSLEDAASLPEVACTVWSTVFMTSRLSAGETFLVHGGSSGIGTFAIQMAKFQGARVLTTAGGEEKLAACKDLGADVVINYKTEDFVARVKEETGRKGVDVILDHIGGAYLQRNLDSLNFDGRLLLISIMGGAIGEVNLNSLLTRRLTVQDGNLSISIFLKKLESVSCHKDRKTNNSDIFFITTARLRFRSPEKKAEIIREVEKNVWPAVAAGKVKPVVYKYFPLSEAAAAHRLMESSKHIGKILLCP